MFRSYGGMPYFFWISFLTNLINFKVCDALIMYISLMGRVPQAFHGVESLMCGLGKTKFSITRALIVSYLVRQQVAFCKGPSIILPLKAKMIFH